MKIDIVSLTEAPLDVISSAAGTSYGKKDVSHTRAYNCFKAGHLSIFEHAKFTARVEGISRACSHQLVRHRVASFVQQSQRYCTIDTKSNDWYVKPEAFDDSEYFYDLDMKEFFDSCMVDCARNYNSALRRGVKQEDARYLLPESCKTEIVMTMNARELFHFLTLRLNSHAQWEIRELAENIVKALSDNKQWKTMLGWHEDGRS